MKIKPDIQIETKCSRRNFFKNSAAGIGKIVIWSFTVPFIEGCSSIASKKTGIWASVSPRRDRASIIVDVSKTENRPLSTVGGTLALGVNDVDWKGMLLYRESETMVKAFSRECTHEQCTISPFINGISSCPCHRSKFNLSGDKISGPARGALNQYTTAVDGNLITIIS